MLDGPPMNRVGHGNDLEKALKSLRRRYRRAARQEFDFSQKFTNIESKAKAWGRYGAFLEVANRIDRMIREAGK